MLASIKRIYGITAEKKAMQESIAKHIDGRSKYTALDVTNSIAEYNRTLDYGAAERLTGVTRNTLIDWIKKYGSEGTDQITIKKPVLGRNRIHASLRRDNLLALVKVDCKDSESLAVVLGVSSNTVRNDIRKLLNDELLVNLSENPRSYLVRAA